MTLPIPTIRKVEPRWLFVGLFWAACAEAGAVAALVLFR